MMVWIDIETTGLDASMNYILEVGMTVTTDGLEPINSASIVVAPPWPVDKIVVDDVVDKMHTASGLWTEVKSSTVDKYMAQDYLLKWLDEQGLEPGKHPMCGSSVGFDRQFLYRQMPKLESWFHYRNIDVSTVKELSRRWDGPKYKPSGKIDHRALPDIENSITELRFYLESEFLNPVGVRGYDH